VGDGLYLIVDGRTDINKRDGEWDVTFKTLEIGEVVGEISLVTEGPAIASVVTDGDTRVLFLDPESVHKLCSRFPTVMAELRESAAKRLLSHSP
jgi:CRP-like cAMP-binding protein